MPDLSYQHDFIRVSCTFKVCFAVKVYLFVHLSPGLPTHSPARQHARTPACLSVCLSVNSPTCWNLPVDSIHRCTSYLQADNVLIRKTERVRKNKTSVTRNAVLGDFCFAKLVDEVESASAIGSGFKGNAF